MILDTAGRLAIDDELMDQLRRIETTVEPDQVLVVDGMTGQDAVAGQGFNEALELDGVILTKLDGDARGGAALSVKEVTGVPIKFIGTGEHLDALRRSAPTAWPAASWAWATCSAHRTGREGVREGPGRAGRGRLREGDFTFDDFRDQMRPVQKMGSCPASSA